MRAVSFFLLTLYKIHGYNSKCKNWSYIAHLRYNHKDRFVTHRWQFANSTFNKQIESGIRPMAPSRFDFKGASSKDFYSGESLGHFAKFLIITKYR